MVLPDAIGRDTFALKQQQEMSSMVNDNICVQEGATDDLLNVNGNGPNVALSHYP